MQGEFTQNPSFEPDLLKIFITSISHDGRGIGFLPAITSRGGLAVFVPGALPGQKILCRPTRKAKNFLQAELLEIIDERPDLEWPLCPHWQICGGCPLQRLPYAEQLTLKESILKNALQRIGHFDTEAINRVFEPTQASPLTASFRNKVEFAIGDNGKPVLGFRKAGSHTVFDLQACAAINAGAVDIAKKFTALIQNYAPRGYADGKGYWRFLTLRENSGEKPGWTALCLTSRAASESRKLTRKIGEQLLEACPGLKAFIHEERHKKDYLAIGEKRIIALGPNGENDPDATLLTRNLAGKSFQLDAASFFQINGAASEILCEIAREMAEVGGKVMLDLYSGAGVPGLLLAPAFTTAIFLEADIRSAKAARLNAKAHNLNNCQIYAADAAAFPEYLTDEKVDLCLLDPPRQGLSANVMAALLKAAPARIIYISCNPATFARDAALLNGSFTLERLAAVDLFPHTPHIESISLWTRKGS